MELVVTYLAVIFVCGLIAHVVRLPPLIGFVVAGFLLNAGGVPEITALGLLSNIGVTLMLFAIGLRLDLRALADRAVWVTAGAHMLLMTVLGSLALLGMSALGAFGPAEFEILALIGLLGSFSSTIVVVKILQDRGDEQALYGTICIGILIMQDIAAVALMSVLRGSAPSIFSLGLLLLVPALMVATKHWYRLGHGELGALFGIAMALIPGYALFEWLGLSGSLGALIMGLILAPRPGAEELSRNLFTVKELLLVGFFVSIGFTGLPTLANLVNGALLLLLLPLQALLYWVILWVLGLRNRTSVLTSLALSNYSEFSLIIASMGVAAGWLSSAWMLDLVIAVSLSFVVAALVNPHSVSGASKFASRLPTRPPNKTHPEDRPIELGDANAIVLGMGTVGRAAYRELTEEYGYTVLGVEHDHQRVKEMNAAGKRTVEGDATDIDFWQRVAADDEVELIVLCMPFQRANIAALRELRASGLDHGTVASAALYKEDVEELEKLGIDVVIHLYAGAGETLADRVVAAHRNPGTGLGHAYDE